MLVGLCAVYKKSMLAVNVLINDFNYCTLCGQDQSTASF